MQMEKMKDANGGRCKIIEHSYKCNISKFDARVGSNQFSSLYIVTTQLEMYELFQC